MVMVCRLCLRRSLRLRLALLHYLHIIIMLGILFCLSVDRRPTTPALHPSMGSAGIIASSLGPVAGPLLGKYVRHLQRINPQTQLSLL